jgi:hypothetical protein
LLVFWNGVDYPPSSGGLSTIKRWIIHQHAS